MISRYEQFTSVISGLYRQVQKIERDEMIKFGYRGAFTQYLATLLRYPEGLTASQLCEICEKDKAAVSRIVNEMEEEGLIERQGPHAAAYKAKILLTEKGREVAEYVQDRAETAVKYAGRDLTEETRQVFYAALDSISTNLQQIRQNGIPAQTAENTRKEESP